MAYNNENDYSMNFYDSFVNNNQYLSSNKQYELLSIVNNGENIKVMKSYNNNLTIDFDIVGCILKDSNNKDDILKLIKKCIRTVGEQGQYLSKLENSNLLKMLDDILNNRYDDIGNRMSEEELVSELNRVIEYRNARNTLVETNLRLAHSFAKSYSRNNKFYDEEELKQDASMGLLDAIRKFDICKGTVFSSYASGWIRQRVRLGSINNTNSINVGIYNVNMLNKIFKFKKLCIDTYGEEPTDKEIGKYIGRNEEWVREFLNDMSPINVISLDEPISDGIDSPLVEFIADDVDSSIEELTINTISKNEIFKIMENYLDLRQIEIIMLKCGFFNNRVYTFNEIGKIFNISGERVRQIMNNCYDKIRNIYYDGGKNNGKER